MIGSFAHPLEAQAQDIPLVSIVAPTFNSTYDASTVEIEAHFGPGADTQTFQAHLNGLDITHMFSISRNCSATGLCDLKASVPDTDLLNGANIVTVDAGGPNESVGADRVKFEFAPPSGNTLSVSRLLPSVAIQSVYLPKAADQNNVNSYQIVVGPGPGYAQRIYNTANLTCAAGINSVQVLALKRQTLTPDTIIGAGSGQACYGDATSLATGLRGIPAGDIVIVNNFLGLMPNVDTTAMGGSKYSGTGISTHYYNAIGVAGAPAGTAFESYQTNENHTPRLGRDALPPLIGSLMLDIRQNYYFVPSSYPELEVAAGTSDNHGCATFSYNGGAPATQCVWDPDIRGGFVIWAVDRLLGSVTDHYGLPTNSTDAVEAKRAIDDFAYLLNVYYKRNDLLVITTFGTPIGANALITPDLFFAINALGGTGILLPKLTTDTSTYTLISSRDPEYVRAHYPLQSSSPSGGTGQVHAMLSRDRNNRFVLNTGASDQALSHTIGFPWTEVGFQQAQDWPAWTAGQQGAYKDLYSSENHYPAIRERLGCAGILVCQPIRSYRAYPVA
jgi:hypothetical protein